jgi:acyl-CoA reductase-like NAD-dependent aldehyde dehydrogenase
MAALAGAESASSSMRDSCVVALLPCNFPMAMLAWKIGPALATGNSVVIKRPEPATLRLAELASQAAIPDGVFNVIPGLGHIAGNALGLHPEVDMITFTGSTEVGRRSCATPPTAISRASCWSAAVRAPRL